MKRLFGIVLCLALALPIVAQEEPLCTDGTLLFREDFGGNDPSDPRVGTNPVPGMTYTQVFAPETDAPGGNMRGGCYLVTKEGYRNSNNKNYSCWHIMDDHTYPNDKTRGYLMEVDALGSGNNEFFCTTIDGLCAGNRLTFSAYVANLTTAGQYLGWISRNYVHPKLSFIITDPDTNTELARYNTDTIGHDWGPSVIDGSVRKKWQESADWQLVGMNFTVPEGVYSVRLAIRNNALGSTTGNDFALDDIEIHLCTPPVTIEGEREVCENTATTLAANFTNDGTFAEPLEYKWWHSTDSLTWTEIADFNGGILTFNAVQKNDSGWYKVAVSGDGNIESVNCRAMSEPFLLTVKECVPLLPVTITIISPDSVCPNDPYTFEVVIENEDQLEAPTDFQWWYRSPEYPTVWNKVSGGNQRDLQIASFKAQHVGWYKLMVAGSGDMDDENKRKESEEFFVTFKKCEPDLCLSGTLLYRDDFGGNDPNDPEVISDANAARAAVPGMSTNYTPCLSRTRGMSSGKFLITKHGYKNGIQWHLMDDHTYPEDLTKGYILQIDGRGDDAPFYMTTIDGLCSGSRLTFSAYVANVHYCGEIQKFYRLGQSYIYPRMKFVLKDPQNGQTLATQYTDDIQPDANKEWDINLGESAEWRLIGMEFTVPEGVESIQMYIYNDVNHNGTGNDFALDDIEIHLCAPPVTIEGETEVCENTATTLTANFTNDGTFAEPLVYKWWHSADSLTWTEMSDFNGEILTFSTIQKADSGWYKVAVSGDGNIESVNCRAVSEPFRLRVNECEPPTPLTPELCIDGTLLFREDFGGNDPSDPRVGATPVNGMTYRQLLTDAWLSMGSGKYLLTKSGYCNGDTSMTNLPRNRSSQWHLQDDHTYPNDKTRGYLLEIDGRGDNSAFYSTTIEGLCEGSKLTFSAYVANVLTWGMYVGQPGRYAYPRLKFVLTDPMTNEELATYDTGDIPFDSAFIGDYACWKQSVEWRLVGMNFTVPSGKNKVKLTIYNNTTGTTGNDFALDDIEIHLCAPPVTIAGESEVCTNTSTTLTANFSNDGTFAEPLEYKWWHSADSITWEEISDFNGGILSFDAIQKADSGWYKVAVSGDGNIESVNCRAMSEPFQLRVNECEPPEPPEPPEQELCSEGLLLFREDFGGNDPNDPIVGTEPVPGMDYSRYTQRLNADHVTGQAGLFWLIKSGYYHADTTQGRDPMRNHSNWYLQDDHTYPNDKTRGYLLEIDGLGGTAPFYSTVVYGVCPGTRLTFSAYVANVNKASNYIDGVHARIYPKLKFEIADAKTHTVLGSHSTGDIPYDPDLTVNTDFWYSSKWYLHGMTFTMPEAVDSIRLTIYNDVMNNGAGNDFALDDIEIRLCMTPDTIRTDTTVCDTLQQIAWRGKEYAVADTLRDTLPSPCGFDSIYYELHVATEHCEKPEPPEPPVPPCPEVLIDRADTTVCDTLMPFTWRGMVFEEEGEKRWMEKSPRDCDSIEHVFTLSTIHCEKPEPPDPPLPPDPPDPPQPADTLYEIIVNKYNWQLLCNNVALLEYFPGQTATAFQWYKNEQAIPGATGDDYSEHNELQGVFQLNVRLDDGRSIWSNIIEIKGSEDASVRVQIYNSQGMPVSEGQMTRGVYLYRYEKGEEVWTEKKVVL